MAGTIWQNPTTLEVNADTTLEYQVFTATAAQTLYTLTAFNYAVGTKSLLLFRNGAVLAPGVDFTELSSTTFSLGVPATGGEQIVAYGFVGITAEVPVDGTGDIAAVDTFTLVRNYPITGGLGTLLYVRGRSNNKDGFEGLFILRSSDEEELPLDDNENALTSAVDDWYSWIRLGPQATETLPGAVLLAAASDIPTLVATDKVLTLSRFNAAFNSIVHGPLATGLSAIMVFDLDTLFYNIDQVVINSNSHSPLPFGQEGFLAVKMGDSLNDGVQIVVGNGSTTQGEVWRRFIVAGVWEATWTDITPTRKVTLDTPISLVNSSAISGVWNVVTNAVLSANNAKTALIRINSQASSASATNVTSSAYIRKGGTSLTTNDLTRVTHGESASSAISILAASDSNGTEVNLDESFEFDWNHQVSGGTGIVDIVLVGYIMRLT